MTSLREWEEILKKPTMLKALLVLSERPMTLSALARTLGTNRQRLKGYLEELERMGLVKEEVCCGLRVFHVTERGRHMINL